MKHELFLFLLLLQACTGAPAAKSEYVNRHMLTGAWMHSSGSIHYPTLLFSKDSIAIFTSRADTLYRFRYRVSGNQLFLKDSRGNETSGNISSLGNDSLVFSALCDEAAKQVYIRRNN